MISRKTISRTTLDLSALVVATALTRFAFRSHYLYDIDSVNFALALKRFDPGVYQPHPPGYFLYVCLGRLADLLFHDANTSLVALSILFSCGAVAMIYLLAENWFGRNPALFAALIFLFSPLAWFHGTVALTYIVEAFFSALVGYLCWRVNRQAFGFIVPAAIAVGLSAGFRPSSLLFLGPLFLFALRNATRKQILGGFGILALTNLAWFIPMIEISGAGPYISSLVSLWLMVPARESVFNSSAVNSLARALLIAGIYFLCFGCAAVLPFCGAGTHSPANRDKAIFTWVWLAPGLLFFTFVYLKFVNSGYLLVLIPPVCAWMGLEANAWCERVGWSKIIKLLTVGAGAAINAALFICAPVYCSYLSVRRFEANLENVIEVLPEIAPASQTMIVGLDAHFLGYRHAGYYLPDYLTVQYPEVRLRSGMRVFAMQNGDTHLQATLDPGRPRNFVTFPLQGDDKEYAAYMAQLLGRFPPGDLHLIERGGNEYAIGPLADIRLLFPVAAEPVIPVVHKR